MAKNYIEKATIDGTTGWMKDTEAYIYNTSDSLGLDNTGKTDCSSILYSITSNIALKEGTYLVSNSGTFKGEIIIPHGAVIKINSGVTLTFSDESTINAGRYKIFDGDGIVNGFSYNDIAYPEWLGSLEKCYSSFNHISLGAKNYSLTSDLVVNRTNSSIVGISASRQGIYASQILLNGHLFKVGNNETISNNMARGVEIKNLNIIGADNNNEAIQINGLLESNIENIYMIYTGYYGLHLLNCVATRFSNLYIQGYSKKETNAGILDESSNVMSVKFLDCYCAETANVGTNTYGFRNIGSKISDHTFIGCEFDTYTVGINVNTGDDESSTDILFLGCDVDSTINQCVILTGNKGNVSFNDCYFSKTNTNTNSVIYNDSTANVIFNGCEITTIDNSYMPYQCIANSKTIGSFIINSLSGVSEDFSTSLQGSYDITVVINNTLKKVSSI